MNYISGSLPRQAADNIYGVKDVCRIVGLVCIVGFVFDMVILGLPPQSNIEWRIGVVQELADRSILLLFGLALFMFGSMGTHKRHLRLAAKLAMSIGIVFFLLCPLSIADSLRLSHQSANTINAQESQLQTEIKAAQANPEKLAENIDLAALKNVSQQLTQQANSLRTSARRTVFKTGISNIGNLLIVGVGLLGLGRCGMGIASSRG